MTLVPYAINTRLPYIGTRQDQVRGEFVTYSRGSASVQISACPGHTDVQDLIPENVITVARYVDIIVFAAQLILPGFGLTLPQRDDMFTWQSRTYRVTAPTATDDVYNFTTMYKDRLRIHGLLVT